MNYSFRLAARVLLYADRQDNPLSLGGGGEANEMFLHGKSVSSACDSSSDRSFMVEQLSYFSFSTTGVAKAVVCDTLSVRWCI